MFYRICHFLIKNEPDTEWKYDTEACSIKPKYMHIFTLNDGGNKVFE